MSCVVSATLDVLVPGVHTPLSTFGLYFTDLTLLLLKPWHVPSTFSVPSNVPH